MCYRRGEPGAASVKGRGILSRPESRYVCTGHSLSHLPRTVYLVQTQNRGSTFPPSAPRRATRLRGLRPGWEEEKELVRPSAHHPLFPGQAETPQTVHFSPWWPPPSVSYTEPGWKCPRPGHIPCLAPQHPLQRSSRAPGRVTPLIFMKLSSRDHKIISA